MVGAGLPQHVATAHALEPAQHVLQRVVEGMAHMERARHIGRRNHDAIRPRATPLRPAGRKGLGPFPRRCHAALDRLRLIGLLDHRRASGLSAENKPSAAGAVNALHLLLRIMAASGRGQKATVTSVSRPCEPRLIETSRCLAYSGSAHDGAARMMRY